jgi:hypothetical protein
MIDWIYRKAAMVGGTGIEPVLEKARRISYKCILLR